MFCLEYALQFDIEFLVVFLGLTFATIILITNFLTAFLILFILSPFVYAYVSTTGTDKRTDYQGKEIAIKVQYAWNKDHKDPINVVLGDEWIAGNLSYHLNSRPVWEGSVSEDKLNTLNKFTCIDNICVGNR